MEIFGVGACGAEHHRNTDEGGPTNRKPLTKRHNSSPERSKIYGKRRIGSRGARKRKKDTLTDNGARGKDNFQLHHFQIRHVDRLASPHDFLRTCEFWSSLDRSFTIQSLNVLVLTYR